MSDTANMDDYLFELFAGVPHTLDVNGAAEVLSCSPDTVRREIDRGNLRSFKVGKKIVRVTRKALVEYVKERGGL